MLGSICIVAFGYCPQGFVEASGQIMAINVNTALFSLLGTTYGGDGRTTFALPDLRGRVPRGLGTGPGLGNVVEGQLGGQETVTLTQANLPTHTHTVLAGASTAPGNADSPTGTVPARTPGTGTYTSGTVNTTMAAGSTGPSGNSQPVGIVDPYLGLRFCIATQGIYPSRP
jgi:microcystin-dependent protein